jgi:cytochrome c biogenesis protein CcmG, thiol:disulfide interchange protein DsbE
VPNRNRYDSPLQWRCHALAYAAPMLVLVLVLVAACTGGETGVTLDPTQKRALADFPAGVGRGYPVAQLVADKDKDAGLQPGATAPDFALVLDDGSHLRLSDLRGRPVVINFWATWCGPCRLEMPELMRAATEDPDLVMLAVNVQEAQETVAPFANDFAMVTPVVIDLEGSIQTLYGVRGLPTTYFIDRSGRIGAAYPGILTPALLEERLSSIR